MVHKSYPVPKGWVSCQTGEISTVVGGGTPKTSVTDNFAETDGIPWITPSDLHDYKGVYIKQGKRQLTVQGIENSAAKLVPRGTVLFSSRAPIGYVAIADNPLATNQGFRSFICFKGIVPEYVYYYLKYAKPIAEGLASGTTFPEISGTNAAKIPILVPPNKEQHRIVAKLEKLLAKVDKCKERLEKIPVILKRFRQSVLAAACSGELTADWRLKNPDCEDALGLFESIQNAKKKILSIERVNQLRSAELPETWLQCTLGAISTLITKGASPNWQGIRYAANGVLFVTSENVVVGKLKFEKKFNIIEKRSILQKGDLLTNIVGASIGRSALFEEESPANINQAVALIRLEKAINKEYVLHLMNSPGIIAAMDSQKVDVARANLSLKDLASFVIPLPPRAEQHEIVSRIEGLFRIADEIETRYEKAERHVNQLTQSILAKAFRGELVPQDPNDEPASELLKRIKEEREQSRTQQKAIKKKGPGESKEEDNILIAGR